MCSLGYNVEKRFFELKNVGYVWVCGIVNVSVLFYRQMTGNVCKKLGVTLGVKVMGMELFQKLMFQD